MKKAAKITAWILFILVSAILLIYTYALIAPLSLSEQRHHITLYDRNGDILYESNFGEDMEWTDLEDIPQQVQDAFVAVEDRRFYLHMGVDPIRIVSALRNNMHSDTLQGGSTITQQYAKNLFLTNEQTLQRKIEEFFYAVRLEMHYSKADILEGYLNTLYFGHGIYGISEASSYYFGKDMDELSAGELAMLVGVVNGPGAFSPYLHYENAISRQQTVLQVLKDEQVIDEAAYEEAMNEELVILDHRDDEQEDDIRAYYIDAVLAELSAMNLTKDQLDVYTYFDPQASRALYLSLQENLGSDSEMQAAAGILEPFTDIVWRQELHGIPIQPRPARRAADRQHHQAAAVLLCAPARLHAVHHLHLSADDLPAGRQRDLRAGELWRSIPISGDLDDQRHRHVRQHLRREDPSVPRHADAAACPGAIWHHRG